jgi:hypothetical protein
MEGGGGGGRADEEEEEEVSLGVIRTMERTEKDHTFI